ncbi:MAG: T9SS type A sorting domain-containing protein [Ignavibacteriae bacterium]|nr:T9SS C-terminal target domain-containing protein [Ignavibacteriota bacterium]NOG98230.1 T9SS type A sorting domain-containing protein [Ignavibacteriota bacterium]
MMNKFILSISVITAALVMLSFTNTNSSSNTTDTIFTPEVLDPQGNGDAKALADIDGDGTMDPILGGSNLGWYMKDSSWNYYSIIASPPYQEFSTDMQAEDIDGDGDPDIIVGDAGGINNLLWFENPRINPPAGSGSDPRIAANWVYHVIGTHGDWVHDIEIGDLDNDGKLDVVSSGHGHTHVWKNNLPSAWLDIPLQNAGKGISIGDINKNGRADIAIPNGWFDTPVSLAAGTWNFYQIDVGTAKDEVLLMDVNGDNNLDLVTIDAHNRDEFAWFQAPLDPTSSTWTKTIIDGSMGAHKLEAADFNNDGFADILAGLELSELSIYFNSADSMGVFTKQQIDTKAAHNARAGDIDNDGDIDVFGADYINHPPALVYINESAIPVELTSFSFNIVEGKIILNWTTATEINNSHFIVQRGNDKFSFTDIGRVEGNGTTTEISNYSYQDISAEDGIYFYRLKQVDYDGSFSYSNKIEVDLIQPLELSLQQNYPNPFNPTTTIKYQIPPTKTLLSRGVGGVSIALKVFDVIGREIATLVNERQKPGNYEVVWDASEFSSGVYFYRLDAGDYFESKKMILLK